MAPNSNVQDKAERLRRVCQLLALDASDQEACFPTQVVVADEIALLLNDEAKSLANPAVREELGASVAEGLLKVDARFGDWSGKPHYWTVGALRNGADWAAVRTEARALCNRLGLRIERPQLDWLTFVRGAGQ